MDTYAPEQHLTVNNPQSLREAWTRLLTEPWLLFTHWNYKGAILSSAFRAPVFLITYLAARESLKLAIAAAVVQFIFRFFFAGLTGYVIQAFRKVEPAWKASASILIVVPAVSHLVEFLVSLGFVYFTATTDLTDKAIVRSVCFSIFSSLFVLFIMRRNVLIVGESESRSIFSDIRQLPALVYEFIMFLPNEIAAMIRSRKILAVVVSFAAWGVFSQLIGWAMVYRHSWTYGGGKDLGNLKFWGVDGIILMLLAVAFALVFSKFRREPDVHITDA